MERDPHLQWWTVRGYSNSVFIPDLTNGPRKDYIIRQCRGDAIEEAKATMRAEGGVGWWSHEPIHGSTIDEFRVTYSGELRA